MIAVSIYVEGPSDKTALAALLRPLIELKAQQGISIRFFEAPRGDKKQSVMQKVPRLAVNILRNDPNAIVVAIPDLYPLNKAEPHETPEQLFAVMQAAFRVALRQSGVDEDSRYAERFKTFCLKYDLEALILAAEEALALRLNVDTISITWRKPVEDQNKDRPPKMVVEALFNAHHTRYVETADAPLILGLTDYRAVAEACPQCFKPFVEFLEKLT